MPFIVWFHFHTWTVVVVCEHVVSVRGWSFSNVGGHFHMWAVVMWWWWWWSAMAGLSICLPRRCQRHGTWLPCQQRKWGEGWVDVPCRCCCVTSIWPALIHLVTWRCCVVLVVLGHSMVGWLTRVRQSWWLLRLVTWHCHVAVGCAIVPVVDSCGWWPMLVAVTTR